MSTTNFFNCARCQAPVKSGETLCQVCREKSKKEIPMISCRACGRTNPQSISVCIDCGAPLAISPLENKTDNFSSSDDPIPVSTGRKTEMQILTDCFNLCNESSKIVAVQVSGQRGMGVSDLLDELTYKLKGRVSKSQVFFQSTRNNLENFPLVRHFLKKRFKFLEKLKPVAARIKLSNEIGRICISVSAALITETTHLLGHMMGITFPMSPVLSTLESNTELFIKRTGDALTRFFEADYKKNPLVLIFDNVNKSQEKDLQLFEQIIKSGKNFPLFLVFGCKEDYRCLANVPDIVRLTLEPLDDEIMRHIFSHFMPKLTSPPEDFIEAVLVKAKGNPGTLREICSLLVESGVVEKGDDIWVVNSQKMSRQNMPVSLNDAFTARLNNLDTRDKMTLQCAAIVGEMFWDEAVISLARLRNKSRKNNIGAGSVWADDSDNLAISSSISRLIEKQFIVQIDISDLVGCQKFAFVRPKIREQILKGIDLETSFECHYAAAEWMSHQAKEFGIRFAEMEAYHYEAARDYNRAAFAIIESAKYARSRFLNQKAIDHFEKGLSLIDERNLRIRVDIFHDLGSVYELTGEYKKAEDCYTEMLKLAWILVHRGKAGAALNKIGRLYRARGDYPAAKAFLTRSISLFKSAGDERGIASNLADLGELARRHGKYDSAFKLLTESYELQKKMNLTSAMAVSLHSLGHVETARGAFKQAEKYLEQAYNLRKDNGDVGGMAKSLSTLAIVSFNRNDLDLAIERWMDAIKMSESAGDVRMTAIIHNNLGESFVKKNQLKTAMKHFSVSEKIILMLEDTLLLSEVSRNIGVLHGKNGDYDKAAKMLEKALKLARQSSGRELEALVILAMGDLASNTVWDTENVDQDKAEKYYNEALGLFKAIGGSVQVAKTVEAIGLRRLELGKVEDARATLGNAADLLKDIDPKAAKRIRRTIKEIR